MKKTLTALCAVLLVLSMTFALVSCSFSEDNDDETTSTVQYTQSNTVLDKSSEEVLSYFNSLVDNVKEESPAISYKQEIKISNDTIKITKADGSEDSSLDTLNDAAPGIKDLILTDIKKKTGSIDYGVENQDVFFVKGEAWASELTVDDISSATVKEIGDKYYITISFDDIPEAKRTVLAKAFELRDKATILNSSEFVKTSTYMKFNDYSVEYTGCTISATVDRLTDTLENVTYVKNSDVTADVTGQESFESYGDMLLSFVLTDTTTFDFTWTCTYETSPLDTTAVA